MYPTVPATFPGTARSPSLHFFDSTPDGAVGCNKIFSVSQRLKIELLNNHILRANILRFVLLLDTGVHPCSCNSPNLPAPDTQITNTYGRALCQTCVTRWVGRGGVGITCFSIIHVRLTTPADYKRSKQYVCRTQEGPAM